VDNKSTDSTGTICDTYAAKDSRVKVIHRKEQGWVSDGRNDGLAEAAGEWITFVDADDWLEIDFYQEMFNRMPEDSDTIDIMFSGGHYHYYKDGSKVEKKYRNSVFDYTEKSKIYELIRALLNFTVISNNYSTFGFVWDKLYRTDFVKKNSIIFEPDILVADDIYFNLIAFEKAGRIAGTDYIGYHYWLNPASVTHKYISDYDTKFKHFLIRTKKNLQKEDIYACVEKSMNTRVFISIFSMIKQKYFNRLNDASYMTRKKEFKKLMEEDIFHDAIYGEKNKMLFKYELLVFLLKIHFYFPFELYYRYRK
jgi:glycosyltransferase EpsH